MIRRTNSSMSFVGTLVPWGAKTAITPGASLQALHAQNNDLEMVDTGAGVISADVFMRKDSETHNSDRADSTPKSERPKPESMTDPTVGKSATMLETPHSVTRATLGPYPPGTTPSNSSVDLFYTPMSGKTPAKERSQIWGETKEISPIAPPSAFRPLTAAIHSDLDASNERRVSAESEESITEDFVRLLEAGPSPRQSLQKLRDRSASISSRLRERAGSIGSLHHSGSRSSSRSSNLRRKSSTGLSRARSTSVSLLKESVVNTAAGSAGMIRRARSGTILSGDSGYSKVPGDEEDEVIEFGKGECCST